MKKRRRRERRRRQGRKPVKNLNWLSFTECVDKISLESVKETPEIFAHFVNVWWVCVRKRSFFDNFCRNRQRYSCTTYARMHRNTYAMPLQYSIHRYKPRTEWKAKEVEAYCQLLLHNYLDCVATTTTATTTPPTATLIATKVATNILQFTFQCGGKLGISFSTKPLLPAIPENFSLGDKLRRRRRQWSL